MVQNESFQKLSFVIKQYTKENSDYPEFHISKNSSVTQQVAF